MHVIDYSHLTYTPAWALRSADLLWGETAYLVRRNRMEEAAHVASNCADVLAAGPSPRVTFARVMCGRPEMDRGQLAQLMISQALSQKLGESTNIRLTRRAA